MARAIEGAGSCRRSRRRTFAVRPEQTGQTCRRDTERHGKLRAEQAERQVPRRRSVERPRQEGDILESLLVAAQRSLVLGAAVREVEHRARQHSTRGGADRGRAVQVLERAAKQAKRQPRHRQPERRVRVGCGAAHDGLPPMLTVVCRSATARNAYSAQRAAERRVAARRQHAGIGHPQNIA